MEYEDEMDNDFSGEGNLINFEDPNKVNKYNPLKYKYLFLQININFFTSSLKF
jgi:hypothetical protein